MCGIAGWVGDMPDAARLAGDVAASLHHRGPDARGVRHFPGATLIHTRLSIIDLSPTGAQPMASHDESSWVVFNGEIYNHHQLRAELEGKGYRFRGRSDTEVLPALFCEYGPAAAGRLRGMFAFAIYTPAQKKLFVARDRFGIKPLLYLATPRTFAFSSEMNALLHLPMATRQVDRQAVYDFAALFFMPAPATLYQDIRALEPGESMEVTWGDAGVTCSKRRFFRWSLGVDDSLTLESARQTAGEKLDRAVAGQMESDVPLGSLLSGGIDSSLVSATANQAAHGSLLTYNVRFPDKAVDETWAAREVARRIGSRHETLDVGALPGTWDEITGLLRHAGQPLADSSLFPVAAVCAQMRKKVTVALSGDGGDEAFGGYHSFSAIGQIARIQAFPSPLRNMAGFVAAALARLGVGPRGKLDQVRTLMETDPARTLATVICWVREKEHARLCLDTGRLLPVARHFEWRWRDDVSHTAAPLEKLSAHLTEVHTRLLLPDDFCFKVDAASMRASLEVRVPMMDEEFFQFGLSLPHRLKVKNGTAKYLLRSLAEQRLGAQIAWKKKQGFELPVDSWVDAGFRPRLREELLNGPTPLADFFRAEAYRPIVAAFCGNNTLPGVSRMGLYHRILMLLSLHVALQR